MIHRKLIASALTLACLFSATILSCSSAANLPNPFASATPTATATYTPTITPSPTPTLTPTATPKPTGMVIRDAPGGGSRFFDYDNGYIIDVPSEWTMVLLEPGDMQAAISRFVDTNPNLANAMRNNQGTLSKAFRMTAFDQVPEHYADGYVTNFSVATFPDRLLLSMPLDLLVQATVDQAKKQMPGSNIRMLPTKVNAQALPIGSSESHATLKLPGGGQIAVYEKQYYFLTSKAFVVVVMYAPKDKAVLVTPLFDKISDNIRLLQQ